MRVAILVLRRAGDSRGGGGDGRHLSRIAPDGLEKAGNRGQQDADDVIDQPAIKNCSTPGQYARTKL